MFQFLQNNALLLFHIIVSLWGAGAFSRDFTTNLTRALKNEKLKAPPFPGPGGAGDTNDWCNTAVVLNCWLPEDKWSCKRSPDLDSFTCKVGPLLTPEALLAGFM